METIQGGIMKMIHDWAVKLMIPEKVKGAECVPSREKCTAV